MERTKNLNLIKPAVSEYYDVEQFNQNSDIIDEAIQKTNEDIEDVNKRLTTADGLKFQFAKNEDGEYGYVNENGEFSAFKKGGSNSVVLPPAPVLDIDADDGKLTVSWEQPKATECEVDIASYNIYMSDTVPFSLADMQLIASQEAGYKKMDYEYNLDVEESDFTFKVRNNQIYIDGENYVEYYISPALQFEAGKSYRLSGADGTKGRMFIYGSDAINVGTIATDEGAGCEFTATASAALPLAFSVEPDRNYDSRFHIGIEEKVRENSYVIEGLENDKVYFIAVQAVTVDGIENASIYKLYRCVPTPMIFVCSAGKPYWSRDGINWTAAEGAQASMNDIVFANDKFVAVGSTDAYYSADGMTWVSAGSVDASQPYATRNALAYGDNRYVCVCKNGYLYHSVDGKSWTQANKPGTSNFVSVAYGHAGFVAVTDSAGICKSVDGKTWGSITTVKAGGIFYDIAYGDGRYVAVGHNGNAYVSEDGSTWSTLSGMSSVNILSIAYGNGRFVAVGNNGNAYYLNDGATRWVTISSFTSANMTEIMFAAGVFVCNCGNGKTAHSDNGINWTVESTGLQSSAITAFACNKM